MFFRGPGASDSPVKLEGDPLIVDIDARAIVDVARRVVLRETRENIAEGKRPDGGPQRPLSKRHEADPNRVSPHRGYRTGVLADELRSSPIKGDTSRASARVLPPTSRNVFIAMEAKRGVEYLGMSPAIDAEVIKAVDQAIEDMLDGLKVVAEQGEPTAKEESK
jgi:hypothetical protein